MFSGGFETDQHFDLMVQLGSQVMYVDGQYRLAPHTGMRTVASVIALKKDIAPRLIVCGGSNFGVRYDDERIFNDFHPTQKKAVFTFEAFADSDSHRKSEATVIKDALIGYGVPSNKVLAETLSSTTEENAEFLKILLRRRPMFTGNEKIGLLTLLYHMEKALPVFQKAGLNVQPVFAENLLVLDADRKSQQTQQDLTLGDDPVLAYSIDEICEYYRPPRGGKQYDVNRIRELLHRDKPLSELWTDNPLRNPYGIPEEPNHFQERLKVHLGASTIDKALAELRQWQMENPPV